MRILPFAIVNHHPDALRQVGRLQKLVPPRVNTRHRNIVPLRHSQNAGFRRKGFSQIWSRSPSLQRRRHSGPVITMKCRIHRA